MGYNEWALIVIVLEATPQFYHYIGQLESFEWEFQKTMYGFLIVYKGRLFCQHWLALLINLQNV